MKNINFVVYTHTDYMDILNINLDFSKGFKKTLVINQSELNPNIIDKFDSVVYYDDSKQYGDRVYSSLTQLDDDYILFTHDIDIPLYYDEEFLIKLQKEMINRSIDRIDLQQDCRVFNDPNIINRDTSIKLDNFTLIRNDSVRNYIYNVNPSLWCRDSFIKILEGFRGESYRSIEVSGIQKRCLDFKIYKCHHTESSKLGWFWVTPIYRYLHITHGGRLLPISNEANGLDTQTQKTYEYIVNKFELTERKRVFSSTL